MEIKDLIARLEPEQSTTTKANPEMDLVLMSATSAAVSLKRIADALDQLAEAANTVLVRRYNAGPYSR